jgi:hypothetical protein
MRPSFWAGLIVGGLGLLFTAAMALAGLGLESILGLARSPLHTTDVHVDLSTLHHGLLSWDSVYESPAAPLVVWHTVPRLANMELEEGGRSSDSCLKLWQVEQFHLAGRTTTVKLCRAITGTRLYVNQRLYVRP